MDAKGVREWKARFDEVNAIQIADKLAKSPADRFIALHSFLARLNDMGKLSKRESDLEEHLRWAEIQKQYIERHTRPK